MYRQSLTRNLHSHACGPPNPNIPWIYLISSLLPGPILTCLYSHIQDFLHDVPHAYSHVALETENICSFSMPAIMALLGLKFSISLSPESFLFLFRATKPTHLNIHSEGLMLKLKLQYFGHLMQRTDSLEKTLVLGKIEGGRRRGRQDEMVGWHHRLNGHEFEQAPGVDVGQGSLAFCSPWGRKESNMTEWLNGAELKPSYYCFLPPTYLPKTLSTPLEQPAQSEGYFGSSKCSSLNTHKYN